MRVKRKVALEQFYTNADLVQQCLKELAKYYPLDSFDHILEPSAGDGAFFSVLPTEKRIGIDLEPAAEGIQKMDFYDWLPEESVANSRILTIGNPPFGQRGAMAISFLNRACEFSQVVAFILPRSFKKDTFLNRVNPNFHLLAQFDCEDFHNPRGEKVLVQSVFQIWEKRDYLRPQIERPTTHPDFELKHAHLSRTSAKKFQEILEYYDFAIAQVGSNFSPREIAGLSKGSYWFIKENKAGVREKFELLDFSFLKGMNLSFMSLSKKDIIQAYDSVLILPP